MVSIAQTEIINEAEVEEKNYNWQKAATLYAQAADAFFDEKSLEKAAIYYKKLGYAYINASHTADTSEEFKRRNTLAIEAYKNALDLFNQLNKIPEDLECEAEISRIEGYFAESIMEGKVKFNKSYETFIKSSEIYRSEDDQESTARTLCRAIESLYYLTNCSTEQEELENYIHKGFKIGEEAVIIAKEGKYYDVLAEILNILNPLNFLYCFIMPFKKGEEGKKLYNYLKSLGDVSLRHINECKEPHIIAKVNIFTGMAYAGVAVQFTENAIKQKEYGDKGITLIEIGLEYLKKTNNKKDIINGIFAIDYLATSLRRFNYVQKRIWYDIHILLDFGKIYEGVLIEPNFLRIIFPAFYYTNLSQRSFIKPDQQK
ncbi:MAG: hypothetical protein ACFFBI_15205, partial [Promethearchaeota archaeon]